MCLAIKPGRPELQLLERTNEPTIKLEQTLDLALYSVLDGTAMVPISNCHQERGEKKMLQIVSHIISFLQPENTNISTGKSNKRSAPFHK